MHQPLLYISNRRTLRIPKVNESATHYYSEFKNLLQNPNQPPCSKPSRFLETLMEGSRDNGPEISQIK